MKIIRNTIIYILSTCLFVLVFAITSMATNNDDYIKVGLKFGSASISSCTLISETGFYLGTAQDRCFVEGMPLPAYKKLVATFENGCVVLRDENGNLLSADIGASGCIMPANYMENGVINFNDLPYRDGIMLLAKSNGTMTVINYITMEHYVYGVLNSELDHKNPTEALKAQAVAARSFAELNLNKHSADGFDLCTTTHCQVYKGYSGEYQETNSATDMTAGEKLYRDGKPVSTFYFKNSGGYTQNSEDVWSFSYPYLRAIKDEYSPSYPWSTSLSFTTIQEKLKQAGYTPGAIQSISIVGRNATGAVAELKIVGNDSTVKLTKEKIRNVLGATIIKSNSFSLGESAGSSGQSAWKISNGVSVVSAGADIHVINGDGVVSLLNKENVYGSNGTQATMLGGTTSSSEIVTGGMANFNGFGYGHGVGMPQDSAVEMAKQGFTYDKILKYYYTGVELQKEE